MRRAMSVLLFVIVFSACLGLTAPSALRGQPATSSTPPPAASKPSENPLESPDAGRTRARSLPSLPAASGVVSGYGVGAGMSSSMPLPEAWQAQQEIPRLLAMYGQITDEKERAKIKEGLAKVLEKLFDLQQKERESEIADIEARVKRLRDMLDKRAKARQSIITSRLEQLVREAEGLGWVEPAAGGMPGMPSTSGYPGMPGMGAAARSGYGSAGAGYDAFMPYGSVQAAPAAVPRTTPGAAKPPAGGAFKKRSGSSDSGSKSTP